LLTAFLVTQPLSFSAQSAVGLSVAHADEKEGKDKKEKRDINSKGDKDKKSKGKKSS